MGQIKGQMQYNKWEKGEELTRKEAMLAMCYQCSGFEESNEDCKGEGCPMYQFSPYRGS